MPTAFLEDSGRALLPAIAYGDALGLPFETSSREDIRKRFGRVTDLVPCAGHKYFTAAPRGTWSDDTQLSLAIAESLLEAGTFDMETIARRHVHELGVTTVGWGNGTRKAIERLRDGTHTHMTSGSPSEGCGVLMKLAPLSYVHEYTDVETGTRQKNVEVLARMTHTSPVAIATAVLHDRVLATLLRSDGRMVDGEKFLIHAAEHARELEVHYGDQSHKTSDRLRRLVEEQSHLHDDAFLVEVSGGPTFNASDVITACYGVFAYSTDFRRAVFRVVHLGGDTDSTGGIVGAMSAALHGRPDFPAGYRLLQQRERLEEVSARLAAFPD